MQPKGKTMLQVTGILYIIYGAVSLLLGALILIGGFAVSMMPEIFDILEDGWNAADIGFSLTDDFIKIIFVILALAVIIGGVLRLIAGILGVKNCQRPEKVGACFVFGVIFIVLEALSILANLFDGSASFSLLGLALAILYTIGASRVKRSPGAPPYPFAPPYPGAPQPPFAPQPPLQQPSWQQPSQQQSLQLPLQQPVVPPTPAAPPQPTPPPQPAAPAQHAVPQPTAEQDDSAPQE